MSLKDRLDRLRREGAGTIDRPRAARTASAEIPEDREDPGAPVSAAPGDGDAGGEGSPGACSVAEGVGPYTVTIPMAGKIPGPDPAPTPILPPPPSAAPSEGAGSSPATTLRERLARIAVTRRHRSDTPLRLDDAGLADRLGGAVVAEGVLLLEERIPPGTRHGDGALDTGSLAEAFAALLPREDPPAGPVVLMDTETTGLAGGTGTVAFVLGLARPEAGGLVLRQYLLTGFAGEPAMLAHAAAWMDGAAGLVTYNGRSFDAPLLATRYRLAALANPFSGPDHLDLLHAVRRRYRTRWDNCRLKTAEDRLLGFVREADLPGAEVPWVWQTWLRYGRHERLPDVVEHNRHDLVSLAVLTQALSR